MSKNKKKRKSTAAHAPTPPPARPMPVDGRRFVSYDDLETGPAPPVPRHMVSYASSNEDAEEDSTPGSKAQSVQNEVETPAECRHRIMSRESDGTYDANRAQPRTDPTYGQVGAFPGLDTYQYAPFYGPANDGIDYLRMVRSEAREIPHIVTSASRKRPQQDYEDDDDEEENGAEYAREMERADAEAWAAEDDGDGYYSDGAYVAKPLSTSTTRYGPSHIDPQTAYYDRLKLLYAKHRGRCQATPSAEAVAALDHDHPISLPQHSPPAISEWRRLLMTTHPLPAQLCSMEKWTVWRLIRLCERHIRNLAMYFKNIPSSLAQWIWGLMGRLQESWQMRNEDISKIRELGKCATWCLTHYRANKGRVDDGQYAQEDDEDDDWDYGDETVERANAAKREESTMETTTQDGEGEMSANQKSSAKGDEPTGIAETGAITDNNQAETHTMDLSDMLAAKRYELQEQEMNGQTAESSPKDDIKAANLSEDKKVPNSQTCAVLELIITVTGEYYGQRDLLWSRPEWQEGED